MMNAEATQHPVRATIECTTIATCLKDNKDLTEKFLKALAIAFETSIETWAVSVSPSGQFSLPEVRKTKYRPFVSEERKKADNLISMIRTAKIVLTDEAIIIMQERKDSVQLRMYPSTLLEAAGPPPLLSRHDELLSLFGKFNSHT